MLISLTELCKGRRLSRIGTYTLRATTANPRASIQVTSDFNDAPFPQASFVFNVVPEPSTLALIGLTGLGAGVIACQRRK